MRTIKFRGKDIETGEFVYGFYTQGGYILEDGTTKERHIIHSDILYDVEEHTIGQYTGLHDKNGKEIYEGDIIIEKLRRARKDGERLVICFDDFECFEWQGKNENGSATSLSLLFEYHTIEVIGNIHDNPELLKGE